MGTVEKIKSKATQEKPAVATTQRKRRMEALAKASTVTFALEPAVRRQLATQAREAGMNLTHYMQKLVEEHIVGTVPEGDPLGMRLAAKRQVIDHAIDVATKLNAAGKFDENFILTVVKTAAKDDEFMTAYKAAHLGEAAEGSRAAARQRVSLNQQIGRVIKKAVGARSKRGEDGKIMRAQVQDTLIATYTLLELPQ